MHRHTVTDVHVNICTGTQLQLAREHVYRHTVTAVNVNICTGTQLQLCT